MNPLEAIRALINLGYHFQVLPGNDLRYEFHGPGKPDPAQVRPLLVLVKEHKPEVLAYLRRPNPPDRVLTCYDCGHFHPAANSPNPTQAWGHCEKRDKGRYVAAMACEAVLNPPERGDLEAQK